MVWNKLHWNDERHVRKTKGVLVRSHRSEAERTTKVGDTEALGLIRRRGGSEDGSSAPGADLLELMDVRRKRRRLSPSASLESESYQRFGMGGFRADVDLPFPPVRAREFRNRLRK